MTARSEQRQNNGGVFRRMPLEGSQTEKGGFSTLRKLVNDADFFLKIEKK
jgi:hypothetical protein